jgi:hypothetical protein
MGTRKRFTALAAICLALGGISGTALAGAGTAGNASSAASFIENAQNSDGGFGTERGKASSPGASLWATVALLAAGKNPQDEALNGGASADDYLALHLSAYRSLSDLGLLAIVQSASGVASARYGDPNAGLTSEETVSNIDHDPQGAALGVIGLLAINSTSSRQAAKSAAQTLLSSSHAGGGWGYPNATSVPTALVLEAIATSGVADATNPTVAAGIAYLQHAQVNDGSIATSAQAASSSSGDVGATAFTIQALKALGVPSVKTSTGTTVLEGLTSYQQKGTGGLSPFGAYDTTYPASVTLTAEAYPAFDGVAFPLPYVPPSTQPTKKASTTTKPTTTAANRVSVGTASRGISSNSTSGKKRVGAYKGASAAGSVNSRKGKGGAQGRGTSVTGSVVGATPAPKLTTRSGRPPGTDYLPLILVGLLVAFAVLGGVLDARRPRRDPRSPVAVGVQAMAVFLAAARARGAAAPLAVLLLGAVLVALPSETGMWSRAPKGAKMITAFAPYMRVHEIDRLQRDVALFDGAVREARAKGPALQFPHAGSAAAAERQFAASDPQVALFIRQWPAIDRRFAGVLDPIKANTGNYAAIAALPSFTLFPWFFLAPGAILIALAAVALAAPRAWTRLRWGILALGVALVLAPVILGMFARAPRGASLVSAFAPVENRSTVTALQDDFGTIAGGQGSLQSELLPALSRRGIGPAKAAKDLPAVTALDNHFVAILGDLTPVLGVMSDNVVNYQAVAALPTFSLFPWLFVIPGVLAAGLVLLLVALGRPELGRRRRSRSAEPQATRIPTPDQGGP